MSSFFSPASFVSVTPFLHLGFNWIGNCRTDPAGWRRANANGLLIMTSVVAECRDPTHSEFKPYAGNNIFFTFIVCDYQGLLLINPRNIISNIIMIFNINSTGGQTRFLTCVARVTSFCLVHIISHLLISILSCKLKIRNQFITISAFVCNQLQFTSTYFGLSRGSHLCQLWVNTLMSMTTIIFEFSLCSVKFAVLMYRCHGPGVIPCQE